jgi:UDP-glucose 4-epimerase
MKCLVTGARGRLGSNLCAHLLADGNEIDRFSRNADSIHLPLAQISEHLQRGVDVLFHLAWSSVPSTSEITPGIEWREDLPLLSQLLSDLLKIQRSDRQPPLFVFFSSCSVYGEGVAGDRVFFESNPKIPKGWYARGKAEAENLIEGFQSLGLPALILRITNPYGFVQGRSAMQGVIPAIFHAIRDSRPLQVWGDGSATKDFIHMEDLLNAIDFLVANRATGIFNIASSQPTSVNELVSLIESQTGCPVEKCYRPPSAWDVQNGRYSNARLSTLTGWAPKISLEAGIQKYAERFFADSKV